MGSGAPRAGPTQGVQYLAPLAAADAHSDAVGVGEAENGPGL